MGPVPLRRPDSRVRVDVTTCAGAPSSLLHALPYEGIAGCDGDQQVANLTGAADAFEDVCNGTLVRFFFGTSEGEPHPLSRVTGGDLLARDHAFREPARAVDRSIHVRARKLTESVDGLVVLAIAIASEC